MLSLYDHQRRPTRIADRLPWFGLVADAPCVLTHKDGSLQSSLCYQGLDLDAVPASELQAHAARLNNVLKRFGSGWAVFVETAKRRVDDYPDASWPNAASAAADEERRRYFLGVPHYGLSQYLTMVWKPQAVTEQRIHQWVTTGGQGGQSAQANTLQAFQDQVQRGTDLLQSCMAWVQPLGPEGTLTYLHSTVSTTPHRVVVPDLPAYLDCLLADRDFVPGMQPALITGATGRTGPRWQDCYTAQHLRTLTITGWPQETYPEMLAALTALPLEYRYVVRWLPLDQVDAYKIMKDKAGLWKQAMTSMKARLIGRVAPTEAEPPEPDREAKQKKEALDAAMDDCMAGDVTFGYLTATVTVWDADARQADANLRAVERVITGKGFSCHPEHLNATEAWLGSLPGQCYANVRRPMLRSLNLVHAVLGGVDTGPERDTHLDAAPVMRVETAGNLPYNLVLHEHGVGHTLIVGPSGSGKTTLVGALALQFQRYHALGARVRLIDKKRGLQPVTQAMGGDHYTLGGDGSGVAFQPLRDCADVAERQWGAAWVEGLCAEQHVPCTPVQRREVWDALTSLAALPVAHRTLTGLYHLVQDLGLRQALHPYTVAGAYGTVLDAVTEPLALRPWACFETDALFDVPALIGPTLGVLFHQLGRTFQDRVPTLFVLDEAWRYLGDMVFRDKIEEYVRELRKLHVSIVFSTQDLNELLKSPISTVILNNCPIRVLLPNKRATEPSSREAYAQIGCNGREIEVLSAALPQRDYLVMTGNGCRVVDLALGPVQLSLLTKGTL